MNEIRDVLTGMFEKHFGEKVINTERLKNSGSSRIYFHIRSDNHNCLGAYNAVAEENKAFLSFTNTFRDTGLNVPEIYTQSKDCKFYLTEYLGDKTLYKFILEKKSEQNGEFEINKIYKTVLQQLARFQILPAKKINYKLCYPRSGFDKVSMLWDLNYFKYNFLKLTGIEINEQKLENDFTKLTNHLIKAPGEYFMYRDFQSRNILLRNYQLYFIDYQGGRKGPLQYDLASLLFDAKAELSPELRNTLLYYYFTILSSYFETDETEFIRYYPGFVLLRILQALGAYGFRGFFERKEHFLQSVPSALKNLLWVLDNFELNVDLNYLPEILRVVESNQLKEKFLFAPEKNSELRVRIYSFSYKDKLPEDETDNGGGYVFDCRSIHNPGKYEEYKDKTGLDKEVISFFEEQTNAEDYLQSIFRIVSLSVRNYIERGFSDLMISFGCTGGQHRSVYCAERLGRFLKDFFNVKVEIHHTKLEKNSLHN
ncbi:MAG: RNase adapter RapZ [Ignavibacteriaceae bacterium]